MKFRITDESRYGDKQVQIYETEIPNAQGRFALDLVERFGLIVAQPDGEDSAGRQKAMLLPVGDVVARAFAIADEAFLALREHGLMVAVPDLNEVNAEADAKREAKRKKESAEIT